MVPERHCLNQIKRSQDPVYYQAFFPHALY